MWESILQTITNVNAFINGIVWGWPMIILILGTGILLSIRTRFIQVRKFKQSISGTILATFTDTNKKDKDEGAKKQTKDGKSVSQFEAFCSAVAGTVGTGNIIGTSSAIITGGPGAVFWMWISAFFGMVTSFSENVLGLYYRKKDEKGDFCGGSFYYIKYGLKWKWLAYIAAIFCMFAAVGMSGVQTNKISESIVSAVGQLDNLTLKLIIGVVVAVFTALIIIGGIKRIGKVASIIVPFMTIIFILFALVIIFINVTAIPTAFGMIFSSIFEFKAMAGGFGGYVFANIVKKGMARGIFSNEAGLGSSVIAHSSSDTVEPVKQGMWGIFAVFFDTFVICTLMSLVFLTTYINSGAIGSFTENSSDAFLAMNSFTQNLGVLGTIVFSVMLPLFAFTTILAWAYYGEKATEFCFGNFNVKKRKIFVLIFKIVFVLLIVLSAVIESKLIWDIDDTFNGLMAIPNLIALVLLSGKVKAITKNYYDRKKGLDVMPMLSAHPDLNEEFISKLKR